MKKIPLLIALFCFGNIVQAQVISDSVLIEGKYRSFHFSKPSQSKYTSLVFVLHGSNGTGLQMRERTNQSSKIEEKAELENMLIVYPDGYKKYWNECRKVSPAEANVLNINEQAFFDAMIQYFKKQYKVRSVFVAGMSGGGHMAYKLALTMPNKFKAIAAFIANLPDTDNMDCEAVGKAIPVMIVNGTEDPINPYNGGEVNLGPVKMGKVQSTERTLAYWSNLARYEGKPAFENLPDTDPTDGRTIEKYTYKKPKQPEIVLLKVIGGKHDFPKDIDTMVEALAFFKRQI